MKPDRVFVEEDLDTLQDLIPEGIARVLPSNRYLEQMDLRETKPAGCNVGFFNLIAGDSHLSRILGIEENGLECYTKRGVLDVYHDEAIVGFVWKYESVREMPERILNGAFRMCWVGNWLVCRALQPDKFTASHGVGLGHHLVHYFNRLLHDGSLMGFYVGFKLCRNALTYLDYDKKIACWWEISKQKRCQEIKNVSMRIEHLFMLKGHATVEIELPWDLESFKVVLNDWYILDMDQDAVCLFRDVLGFERFRTRLDWTRVEINTSCCVKYSPSPLNHELRDLRDSMAVFWYGGVISLRAAAYLRLNKSKLQKTGLPIGILVPPKEVFAKPPAIRLLPYEISGEREYVLKDYPQYWRYLQPNSIKSLATFRHLLNASEVLSASGYTCMRLDLVEKVLTEISLFLMDSSVTSGKDYPTTELYISEFMEEAKDPACIDAMKILADMK